MYARKDIKTFEFNPATTRNPCVHFSTLGEFLVLHFHLGSELGAVKFPEQTRSQTTYTKDEHQKSTEARNICLPQNQKILQSMGCDDNELS